MPIASGQRWARPAGTGEDLRGDAKALTAACQEMMIAGARLREGLASRTLSAWTLGQGRAGYGSSEQLSSHAKVCIMQCRSVLTQSMPQAHTRSCASVAFACSISWPSACCLPGRSGSAGFAVLLLGSLGSGAQSTSCLDNRIGTSLSMLSTASQGSHVRRVDHAGLLLQESC